MKLVRLLSGASCGVIGAMLLTSTAQAQSAAQPPPPPEPPTATDTIIVTAQKRSENIQTVPLSVVAVTGEGLRDKGISNLQDLRYIDPSLNYRVSTGTSSSAFAIRGVGTSSYSAGLEQSVSTVLDGVVLNDPSAAQILADIDRVEVLRGPQGMLFGKNASAGVISITTTDPKFNVFEGAAHLSFGKNNEEILQGIVNLPITDTLAGRVVVTRNHLDGWISDPVYNNVVLNPIDIDGIRAKLRWRPDDRLNAVLSFDANYSGEFCCVSVNRYTPFANSPNALVNAQYGFTASPTNNQDAAGHLPFGNGRVWGSSLNVDYKLGGGYTLTDITGWRQATRTNFYDADYATFSNVDINGGTGKNANFSQELRLTSPLYKRFDFVGGLYYFFARNDQTITQIGDFYTPAPGTTTVPPASQILYGGSATADVKSKDYAAYGQARFHITDTISLIGGARYTKDDLELQYIVGPSAPNIYGTGPTIMNRPTTPYYIGYNGPYPSNVPCLTTAAAAAAGTPTKANCFPAIEQTTGADNVSWRVTLEDQFTPDLMAYATAARGYKGPGFSALSITATQIINGTANQSVRPEIPTSYEIGAKTSFFERRLTINADFFRTDYKDFQAQVSTSTPNGFVTLVQNAGSVKIKGFEMNATARPLPGLALSAGVTLLEARYGNFIGVPCYVYLSNPVTGATSPQAGCAPATSTSPTAPPNTINAQGNRLAGAPDTQYNLAAAYDRPNLYRGFTGHARINWAYQSSVIYQPNGDPLTAQKGFGLLGGEFGFGPANDHWRITVYGTNILNQHWVAAISAAPTQGINQGGTIQYTSDQSFQHFGVRLDARF